MLPTFSRFWVRLPLSMPAALRSMSLAGGVLRMKVKERSSKTVTSAGTIWPACEVVFSLYSLQNAMMLIAC